MSPLCTLKFNPHAASLHGERQSEIHRVCSGLKMEFGHLSMELKNGSQPITTRTRILVKFSA